MYHIITIDPTGHSECGASGPCGAPEVFVDEPQDVRQYADKAAAGHPRAKHGNQNMLGCEHGLLTMFQPNRKRVYHLQTANIIYYISYILYIIYIIFGR